MLTASSVDMQDDKPMEHPLRKPIHKLFARSLKSSSQIVQAMACTALAKLMLSSPPTSTEGASSILDHDELLRMLTTAYFNPDLAVNSGLRQALTYFLPVYCYSRKENQQRMGRITVSVLQWYMGRKEELEVEAEEDPASELVGMNVVGAHLVDWTDGRKLVPATLTSDLSRDEDCNTHLRIAEELLEKVLGICSKEERKHFMSLLGKLHLSDYHDKQKIEAVSQMVQKAMDERVADDAPSRNALNKIQSAISKVQAEPSRSRTPSRAPSTARSVADESEEMASVQEGEESSGQESQPAAERHSTSPAKKGRGKRTSQSSPSRRATRAPVDVMEDITELSNVADDVEGLAIKEEPANVGATAEEPATQRASRPKWRPEELQAAITTNPTDAPEAETTASPPELAGQDLPAGPPRRRGRPKAALTPTDSNTIAPPRPVRKSVRANRRQQQVAAATGLDEEGNTTMAE